MNFTSRVFKFLKLPKEILLVSEICLPYGKTFSKDLSTSSQKPLKKVKNPNKYKNLLTPTNI